MKKWKLIIGDISKFNQTKNVIHSHFLTSTMSDSSLLIFEPKNAHPILIKIGVRKEILSILSRDPITQQEIQIKPPELASYFFFKCKEGMKENVKENIKKVISTTLIPLSEWPNEEDSKKSYDNGVFEPTGKGFFAISNTETFFKGDLDKFFQCLSIDKKMISFLNKHLLYRESSLEAISKKNQILFYYTMNTQRNSSNNNNQHPEMKERKKENKGYP